jgi:hypothetical protein
MSNLADIATRTERFNEAARAFTSPSPTRPAKLMPMKDGIIELQQKGTSLRLIRELLATVGVAVGTDTLARFLAEVNGESQSPRTSKRSGRVLYPRRRTARVQPAVVPAATVQTTAKSPPPQPTSSNPVATADAEKHPNDRALAVRASQTLATSDSKQFPTSKTNQPSHQWQRRSRKELLRHELRSVSQECRDRSSRHRLAITLHS